MEVGVPRPRARSAGDRRRRGRDQLAGGRVDPEDEDSVEALVGDDEEAPARVEGDVVRMRAGLLGAMRPRLALERDEIAQRPERAVGVDRQHRDRARAVVRADEEAVGRVDAESDPVLAAGGLAVEDPDLPGPRVDRVGNGLGAVAMRRVEDALLPVEGQP